MANPTVRNLVARLADKLVQGAVGARPTLAGDGIDVTSWRTGAAFSSPRAVAQIDGTVAATLSSPAGGAKGPEVWGYVDAQWWLIGYLNNGQDVPIVGNLQGFAQELDVIGIFDRIAIAATVSAGAATAKLYPIDVWV